jgi:hypothetical protein
MLGEHRVQQGERELKYDTATIQLVHVAEGGHTSLTYAGDRLGDWMNAVTAAIPVKMVLQ